MAKTAAQYSDEYVKKNKAATEQLITERQNANTNMSNQYVQDMNAIVDQNVANSVNKVQGEIDKLPTTYQSAFDANAVQEKINQRKVKKQMSDLGLTDSGLNRTQQTAIALQRSNADASTRQQMNAASFSLKQQIADLYASGESQKAETAATARQNLMQENQNVYNTFMDKLYSDANAYGENQVALDYQKEQDEKSEYYNMISNGYTQDKNGNWVYTGKPGTKTFDTEEKYDFAYNKIADALTLDTDSKKFNDVLNSLIAQGYSEAAVQAVLDDVLANEDDTEEKNKSFNFGSWLFK